jgi:Fur family transcriptional regulator, peroxide stress response regulator
MYKLKFSGDIKGSNLKVTPQRMAVLEALNNLKNHPTADNIKEFVVQNHPNIAVGTIYKTLETFVEKGLIKKVKTGNGIMRYEAILENHHHLYCEKTEHIEDYFDDELNILLQNYFKNKKIKNFVINEIRLQLNGEFKKK